MFYNVKHHRRKITTCIFDVAQEGTTTNCCTSFTFHEFVFLVWNSQCTLGSNQIRFCWDTALDIVTCECILDAYADKLSCDLIILVSLNQAPPFSPQAKYWTSLLPQFVSLPLVFKSRQSNTFRHLCGQEARTLACVPCADRVDTILCNQTSRTCWWV